MVTITEAEVEGALALVAVTVAVPPLGLEAGAV
jgi:hypothetical protein